MRSETALAMQSPDLFFDGDRKSRIFKMHCGSGDYCIKECKQKISNKDAQEDIASPNFLDLLSCLRVVLFQVKNEF